MIGPDSFQPPTYFFPNQGNPTGPAYQGQPAQRQPTPPSQQPQAGYTSQVVPMATQLVNPIPFSVFQPQRIYNQQVILVSSYLVTVDTQL